MTCRAKSNRTPGGLTIEAKAVSGRRCMVDSTGTDAHAVVATNRSLITWAVTIQGECTTADIEYYGLGAKWPPVTVTVPAQPGKRGKVVVSRQQALVSLRPDPQQFLRTDLHVSQAGGSHAGSDILWFAVATT